MDFVGYKPGPEGGPENTLWEGSTMTNANRKPHVAPQSLRRCLYNQ
jgi:hypothetical protein